MWYFSRFFINNFLFMIIKLSEINSQNRQNTWGLIAAISSATAAGVSAIVAFSAYRSSVRMSKTQMNVVKNQNEMTIYSILTSAKKDYTSSLVDISSNLSSYKIFSEALLNAYNEACSKYFSGNVNEEWFDLIYKNEIFNITKYDIELKETYLNYVEDFPFIKKYFEKHKNISHHKEYQKNYIRITFNKNTKLCSPGEASYEIINYFATKVADDKYTFVWNAKTEFITEKFISMEENFSNNSIDMCIIADLNNIKSLIKKNIKGCKEVIQLNSM